MALIPAMLAGTTFDCSEPNALAAFYLDLFGWKRVWESEDSVLISADGRMVNCLGFQRVADPASATDAPGTGSAPGSAAVTDPVSGSAFSSGSGSGSPLTPASTSALALVPPQRARLEFFIEGLSLDEAQAAAVHGGARLPEAEQPNPNRLRVLVDPAGHTFSLCAMER